jgi:Mor family transcriptional regulator|tara:strand:- start:219 stop:542 length:324 start_codon:yes stop_codon:yes gene_type:complete
MKNKKKSSGVRKKDFKTGSLLHQVAKVDIDLAFRLAKQYGGSKVYISKIDTIKRSVRNRSILKRASVCEGRHIIANNLGLTGNWVGRIIKANIQAYFSDNPLPPVPD